MADGHCERVLTMKGRGGESAKSVLATSRPTLGFGSRPPCDRRQAITNDTAEAAGKAAVADAKAAQPELLTKDSGKVR
jgi:hypothetical protein